MGLFSCLSPGPVSDSPFKEEVSQLTSELAVAKKNVVQLQTELQGLQVERVLLLSELNAKPGSPSKQDAATEMPGVSVAIQVKPPVTQESRIPRPTGEETKEVDSAKSPVKSRIPPAPIAPPAGGELACCSPGHSPGRSTAQRTPPRSPTRSTRKLLSTDLTAPAPAPAPATAPGSAAASPRGLVLAVGPNRAASLPEPVLISPRANACSYRASAGENAGASSEQQRSEVLQQQLKVAEAFRLSLEAELRDLRFANNNLQTQMLSLQTKFEKTVEDQVKELERLNHLRKEGQGSHDQAVQQVYTLKRQLSSSEKACNAAKHTAEAVAKQAEVQEQKLQQAAAELVIAREQISTCMEELAKKGNETSSLATQMQAAQEQAAQLTTRVKQLENELKAQKAIYDSTVEEMLTLNDSYNQLKQAYHKLQTETNQHDQMVQLVQQELSELSYYAAAGRVALGVSRASTLPNFTPRGSEVLVTESSLAAETPAGIAATAAAAVPDVAVTEGEVAAMVQSDAAAGATEAAAEAAETATGAAEPQESAAEAAEPNHAATAAPAGSQTAQPLSEQ